MTIAKQDWDRFIKQALVRLPGASVAAIKGELFDVLNEFFGNSNAWLEDISITIMPNTTEYNVTPADGGQIIRLMSVLDQNRMPVAATMATFGTIVLAYSVNQTTTYTATVSKNVTLPNSKDNIPVAPDWTFSVYGTNILDGLLGRMMGQSGKTYSDAKKSLFHLSKFNSGTNQVRIAVMRRNTLGATAWVFPQNFRTRSQRGGVSSGIGTGF